MNNIIKTADGQIIYPGKNLYGYIGNMVYAATAHMMAIPNYGLSYFITPEPPKIKWYSSSEQCILDNNPMGLITFLHCLIQAKLTQKLRDLLEENKRLKIELQQSRQLSQDLAAVARLMLKSENRNV